MKPRVKTGKNEPSLPPTHILYEGWILMQHSLFYIYIKGKQFYLIGRTSGNSKCTLSKKYKINFIPTYCITARLGVKNPGPDPLPLAYIIDPYEIT